MCRIHAAATRLTQDEKGAAVFEYGLTAAMVAVLLLLAASLLGGSLGATFGGVASSFSTGPFGTTLFGSGQTVPAAGTSFCARPSQPCLPASPGDTCQPAASSPGVTVGGAATAG